MLLRADDRGQLAIGQPSHAWISGQLARAWGNRQFERPEPYEEVCLAAEQHDVGMATWDLAPSWDPTTGLPHSFMEMPLEDHLALWRGGPRRLLAQSRYAALLVSMHGQRLYERRDLDRLPPAQADAIRAFLREQDSFQQGLLASLRDERATAHAADAERVDCNSQLVWTWDFLSLAICLEWAPCTVREVPSASGRVDLRLTAGGARTRLGLDPWPFGNDHLTVRCEGRRLRGRFASGEEMERGLERAPWETVEVTLAAE